MIDPVARWIRRLTEQGHFVVFHDLHGKRTRSETINLYMCLSIAYSSFQGITIEKSNNSKKELIFEKFEGKNLLHVTISDRSPYIKLTNSGLYIKVLLVGFL